MSGTGQAAHKGMALGDGERQSAVPRGGPEARELAELVGRAGRGDARALRKVYDRLSPMALALALRVVGARGEAEEVLQDAFLEVWRRAPEYDPARGEPRAWVLTIVRSRALDRLRSRAIVERTVAASAQEPIDSQASPLEDAERRLERERVSGALDELPGDQRSALELAYYEGLSHSEIAARTGAPLGTIKTRIRLAIEKLARLLGREDA